MNTLTESLKLDLKSYGLNPADWTAFLKRENRVILRHRKDREFTMTGFVRKDSRGEQWRSLELRSI